MGAIMHNYEFEKPTNLFFPFNKIFVFSACSSRYTFIQSTQLLLHLSLESGVKPLGICLFVLPTPSIALGLLLALHSEFTADIALWEFLGSKTWLKCIQDNCSTCCSFALVSPWASQFLDWVEGRKLENRNETV